jgi:hypothetical protein
MRHGDALLRHPARDGDNGNGDAVYKELVANLVPNSHMVPLAWSR